MAKGFKHGASSASPLNFEVKAYPSEVELNTATAKENTIGVVTTNPITGWYFNPVQPENMAEGEVWICVGISGAVSFNALKKNGIQVYPLSAKQYVSGALVDKTAKSYQNGKWVEWIRYLLKDGVLSPEVGGVNNVANCTFVDGEIVGAYDITNGAHGNLVEKVDVTDIKTISFKIIFSENNSGYLSVGISESVLVKGGNFATVTSKLVARKDIADKSTNGVYKEYSLNLENYSGLYYLCFCGAIEYRINEIRVE